MLERDLKSIWGHQCILDLKSIAQIMNKNPVKIYAGYGGPLEGQAAINYFSNKENAPNL